MDRGALQATVRRVAQSRTQLSANKISMVPQGKPDAFAETQRTGF